MIEASGLSIAAGGRRILDNITFRLESGGLYGVIGPNGAGKSTLLAAISGVRRSDEGSVRLFGRSVASWPRRALARRLAVLQQEPLPRTAFTVREVVLMGRYPYQNWFGGSDGEGEALVERVLETLGLKEHAERRLDTLSGGERQRVALAKAMAQDPELLLLDEPTTYLDIGYQIHLLDLVREWQRSGGRTVVAVLHDLNLAAQYCDRLLVLREGRLAAGRPAPALLQPAGPPGARGGGGVPRPASLPSRRTSSRSQYCAARFRSCSTATTVRPPDRCHSRTRSSRWIW